MNKIFLTLISLVFISQLSFAQETPPSTPTDASKPLPTLQKTQNPDTVLTEKVQSKIADLPALQSQTVSAASHDQVITLQGSVENKAQEQAAIDAAKSVAGVKTVESQLTIKAGE